MFKQLPILITFLCCSLAGFSQGTRQESMVPDVDYAYLQRLIDTAKFYYPKMQTFDHRIKAAQANVNKARMGWLDPLVFNYFRSPQNSTTLVNPTLNGYQMGLYLNIGSVFARPFWIKNAKEQVEIERMEQKTYFLSIEAEVRTRYYVYLQKQAILRLRTQSVIDAEGVAKQLRNQFERGETTIEIYNKSLLIVADQVQIKIDAEAGVFIAKTALEELLGKRLEEIQ